VSSILYTAMRLAGILGAAGRGNSATELADGLLALQALIDSWATERLTIYAIAPATYNLTADQASYTIGTGGDFNTTRPIRIEAAGYIESDSETPLDVLTPATWAAIRDKTAPGAPSAIYTDMAVPLATINLYPVPAVSGAQLALYTWTPLSQPASTGDSLTLPTGYLRALHYGLAIELAARFPERANLTPIVIEQAREAKAAIKRLNLAPVEMSIDSALLGTYFYWRTR
jgi:hypothetical protein